MLAPTRMPRMMYVSIPACSHSCLHVPEIIFAFWYGFAFLYVSHLYCSGTFAICELECCMCECDQHDYRGAAAAAIKMFVVLEVLIFVFLLLRTMCRTDGRR